jgi:hypothetical protein
MERGIGGEEVVVVEGGRQQVQYTDLKKGIGGEGV